MVDPFDPAEEQAMRELSERLMPSYDEYVAKVEQDVDEMVENDMTIRDYLAGHLSQGIEEIVSDSYIRGKSAWYHKMAIIGLAAGAWSRYLTTPMELAKTLEQNRPKEFGPMTGTILRIWRGHTQDFYPHLQGIMTGGVPSFFAGALSGYLKFGSYLVAKDFISSKLSDENAHRWRDLITFTSAGFAEAMATTFTSPLECARIVRQTHPVRCPHGLWEQLIYMTVFHSGRMMTSESLGLERKPRVPMHPSPKTTIPPFTTRDAVERARIMVNPERYPSMRTAVNDYLPAAMARQVPYTAFKFLGFEKMNEVFLKALPEGESSSLGVKMGVFAFSGFTTGALAAIITQPADVMATKLAAFSLPGQTWDKIKLIYKGTMVAPGIGFRGLWTGCATRIMWSTVLSTTQWFLFASGRELLYVDPPKTYPGF